MNMKLAPIQWVVSEHVSSRERLDCRLTGDVIVFQKVVIQGLPTEAFSGYASIDDISFYSGPCEHKGTVPLSW